MKEVNRNIMLIMFTIICRNIDYRIYLNRSHADDTQLYALLTYMYSEKQRA